MKKYLLIASFIFLIIIIKPTPIYAASEYLVGANYMTTTADVENGAFIGTYNDPAVRTLVLSQLHDMAEKGARVIKTPFWLTGPGNPLHNYNRAFPLTQQELDNIKQYALDVSSIQNSKGNYLDLYLGFGWLGCADYHVAPCGGGWDAYIVPNAKKTFDDFFSTIGGLTRPDGKKAVQLVYADGEIIIGNWSNGTVIKPNADKFLTELYPYFVAKAQAVGIEPSVYFIIQGDENKVMNNVTTVTLDPAIATHASLDLLYPTIKFMQDHGDFIPKRIDMSIYVDPTSVSEDTLITKVMTDLRTVYPSYDFGIAETYYYIDAAKRLALGQAFVKNYLATGKPSMITFWPYDSSGANSAPPFDIASFLPPAKPGDFNNDGSVNIFDYNELVANFGHPYTIFDYNTLVANFGLSAQVGK